MSALRSIEKQTEQTQMSTDKLLAMGKHFLGNLSRNGDKTGTRNCAAYITWQLKDTENGPEFSACGEVWKNNKSDMFWCGQIVGELAKLFPHDKRAQGIARIWENYHLNGMNAGTPVQSAEIERQIEAAKLAHPEIVYPGGSVNFYKLADIEGLNADKPSYSQLGAGYYELCLHWLKKAGLYEVPLPEGTLCTGSFPQDVLNGARGYRYGERWLYRPLPESVIEEIKSWVPQPIATI